MRWVLAFAAAGLLQAKENPEYRGWSGFNPGSWVKVRFEGELEGRPFVLEQTHTLLEVGPDAVFVGRKGTMRVDGRELPANRERDEIRKNDARALVVEKEGDEEITLPGGKVGCHWIEAFDPKTNSKVKFWMAKEIPGGVARGEIRPETGSSVTKISATSWERR